MQKQELSLMLLVYTGTALFEIAGCFAFWAVFRLHRSAWWLILGVLSLILFAFLLTRIDVTLAGRAYAAYGGIYILSSLVWMWAVENQFPSRWDLTGAGLCLIGTLVILAGRVSST